MSQDLVQILLNLGGKGCGARLFQILAEAQQEAALLEALQSFETALETGAVSLERDELVTAARKKRDQVGDEWTREVAKVFGGCMKILLVSMKASGSTGMTANDSVVEVQAHHHEKAGELARQGAEGEAGPDGRSALWYAAYGGNVELVAALIAAGVQIDGTGAAHENNSGSSPLDAAAGAGNTRTVHVLCARGANVKLGRVKDNVTPLFIASERGRLAAVRILIEYGANVNELKKGGKANDKQITPLFMAAQNGHADVIRVLLAAGADATIGRADGTTPLAIARSMLSGEKLQEVEELLVPFGGDQ